MKVICEECDMRCKAEANALFGPIGCLYGRKEPVWRIQPEVVIQ